MIFLYAWKNYEWKGFAVHRAMFIYFHGNRQLIRSPVRIYTDIDEILYLFFIKFVVFYKYFAIFFEIVSKKSKYKSGRGLKKTPASRQSRINYYQIMEIRTKNKQNYSIIINTIKDIRMQDIRMTDY